MEIPHKLHSVAKKKKKAMQNDFIDQIPATDLIKTQALFNPKIKKNPSQYLMYSKKAWKKFCRILYKNTETSSYPHPALSPLFPSLSLTSPATPAPEAPSGWCCSISHFQGPLPSAQQLSGQNCTLRRTPGAGKDISQSVLSPVPKD